MRARPGSFALLLILVIFFSAPAWADSGKELFEKERRRLPHDRRRRFGGPRPERHHGEEAGRLAREGHRSSRDKLTADKDPIQLGLVKRYGGEMPNLGMSRKDAKKIIAYLQEVSPVPSPSGTSPPAEPSPKPVETVATPELVAQGRVLFTGGQPFANGGAPCMACHGFGVAGVMAEPWPLIWAIGSRDRGSRDSGRC